MNKKLLIVLSLVSITLFSFVGCANEKKAPAKKNTYEVLEEKKINEKDIKGVISEDYKIEWVEVKDKILIVKVSADLDNANSVYRLGKDISEYIKENNKSKITKTSVTKTEVEFIGTETNWLYDGTNTIKKIK